MNTPFSVFRFLAIIAFLGVFSSGIFIKTVIAQQLQNTDTIAQISEIETEEQMRAFIIANLTDNILYGAIAALLIFLIVVPWATQRRAKRQMKYDAMKRELDARRIKDAN